MPNTPIKYIVKEKSLIGNDVVEAGKEVTLPEGTLPADNVEAMCERGVAAKQAYVESNNARVAKMQSSFASDPGSSEALAKTIAHAVTAAFALQKTEDAALAKKVAKKAEPAIA